MDLRAFEAPGSEKEGGDASVDMALRRMEAVGAASEGTHNEEVWRNVKRCVRRGAVLLSQEDDVSKSP